ncbi:uncharacterized protein J3D65DRAFT_669886 [Phyllosticta citribraziliensis]|uniref:Uncharacterized protein n=1 Tax=Phyllosticta citribraziliensis TaxID=989973 RepID=A0ABR1LJX8_9PEZI
MLRQLIAFAFLSAACAEFLGKRQDNDTANYNCHDNCGEAILLVKAGCNVCTDEAFLNDYKNCLQCAGSDNQDIWQYYGPSLTSAAANCSLATTPLTGSQATVASATPAPTGSAANSFAACPTTASSSAASASATSTASGTASAASVRVVNLCKLRSRLESLALVHSRIGCGLVDVNC